MWEQFPDLYNNLLEVEYCIKINIVSRNELLTQAAMETVCAGGKRLRPAFVILAATLGKFDKKKVIPVASAVEVLHTATLIHDDVLDDSFFRRGKETVYKKYGTDMSIYCGDYLYTRAVSMLSNTLSNKKLGIAAKAINTICEGEVDQFRDKYKLTLSVPNYLKRISRKTAILFAASCALGAACSKCDEALSKTLTKIGFYYGMIFQLVDDAKDYLCNDKEWGKPIKNDLSKGIITLPAIYACKNNQYVALHLKQLTENKSISPENLSTLVNEILESGGIDYTRALIKKYHSRAKRYISMLPNCEAKNIFTILLLNLQI